MRCTKFIFAGFLITVFLLSSSAAWTEDKLIHESVLNIEKIRSEEQLSLNSKLLRIYIFLAVLNPDKGTYETYVTSGDKDLDGDGSKAIEEPNDLEEYIDVGTAFGEKITVEDEHIFYINDMPEFEELFPNDKPPFENNNTILSIFTEANIDNENLLTGHKTIPTMSDDGLSLKIERFNAFYNKNDENIVTSYGYIAVQFNEKND